MLSARRPRRVVRGLGRAFLYLSLSIYLPTQALAAIAERFLPEGYFSEDLRGVYMDQHLAFAVFLPHRLPRLAAHFTKLEFPLTLIGLRWFLCLFAADLSAQSTCRLWDVVFSHGAHVANPNPNPNPDPNPNPNPDPNRVASRSPNPNPNPNQALTLVHGIK